MVMVAILIIPMIANTINPPQVDTTYTIVMDAYNSGDEVNPNDLYDWFMYWYVEDNFSHFTVTYETTTIELRRIQIINSGGIKEFYLEQVGEENISIFSIILSEYGDTYNFSTITPSYPNTFTFEVVFDI